jgi:hypothetical protein
MKGFCVVDIVLYIVCVDESRVYQGSQATNRVGSRELWVRTLISDSIGYSGIQQHHLHEHQMVVYEVLN